MTLTGFLLQQIGHKVSQHILTFKCDACERTVSESPFTSDMMPLSQFCSVACRDEAEDAAIDALLTTMFSRSNNQ